MQSSRLKRCPTPRLKSKNGKLNIQYSNPRSKGIAFEISAFICVRLRQKQLQIPIRRSGKFQQHPFTQPNTGLYSIAGAMSLRKIKKQSIQPTPTGLCNNRPLRDPFRVGGGGGIFPFLWFHHRLSLQKPFRLVDEKQYRRRYEPAENKKTIHSTNPNGVVQ